MPAPKQIGIILSLAACLALGPPELVALSPHKTLTQYTRAVWAQGQGLPQDSIHAITQTSGGYLWLGTDEGLSRFDGYDFVTFSKDDGSLPNNSVSALARGSDGALWIGTPGGLTRYSNRQFTTFTTTDGLPDNVISSLVEDQNGTLWIVAGGFLSRFENGKFSNYPMERIQPVQAARFIYEDREHTIWVLGLGGLIKLVRGNFVPVLGPGELAGNVVNTMIKDRNNDIWIGGLKGLVLYTSDGKLRTFYAHGHRENLVRALWEDRDGNVWAGTSAGLSRLDGRHFVLAALDRDRDMDSVRCMFEDREGDLWVGMDSGLNRFHDERFTIYGRTEGLPSDKPVAVHQDRKGGIWVGYNGAGLVEFHEGSFRVYTTRDGLSGNEVSAIRETRDGDLLISTREGLSRMRAGHFSNYVVSEPLGRPVVFDALEDRRGQVWIATPSGTYRMNGQEAHNVIPGGPLFKDSTVTLCEGRDGSIWIGSYGRGLYRVQDGKIRQFTTSDGLGSDQIRSLYQDPDGTLWIGTLGGGLSVFHDGVFSRFTAKDGLLSDNIWHIEDDGNGSLWLSTTRGICRISRQQLRDFSARRIQTLTPVNYGVEDGLRSAQCAPGPVGGGGTRTSDGRLWFPTSRGLAVADRNAASQEEIQVAPILQLVDLTVDNRNIRFTGSARIEPGPRDIQFRYSGIHLSAPERVRYEYRLDGLDQDWIPAGSRRAVSYTGLRHGQYHFRVRASVPEQSSSEASLNIEVLPHFYERQQFLLLCAASILAAIYGLYRLHLRRIRNRFSLVLGERARIAREIHDTLAQGFVGIGAQLHALAIKMRNNDDTAWGHLAVARKMVRHSLTEAKRSMVDLRASVLEDRDLPSALAISARDWMASSSVPVEIDVSGPYRTLPEEIEKNLLRIAQEAVANTLKHAVASRIWIHLQIDKRMLFLTVRDDGRGFEPSCVFTATGEHFGLLGMRERAERLGGEFDLSSKPGGGTQVKVSVPLSSETHPGTRRRGFLGLKLILRPGMRP